MNIIKKTILPTVGNPELLGANLVNNHGDPCTPDDALYTNFAVFAPEATTVSLCLFDDKARETRYEMFGPERGIWHLQLDALPEGQLYGFRADGAWAPNEGLRFNKHKLLIDPYARNISGCMKWDEGVNDYEGEHRESWKFNQHDNAHMIPKSVLRCDAFDWEGVESPVVPHEQSIIYEAHVRGLTMQHPEVPESIRGTYLGACHPAIISHLQKLGINTIELMPVTAFLSESHLEHLGLRNYWGYNPLAFMAPEHSYAQHDPMIEMKTMVREFHRAGIRVVMDVVYNHTCEGGSGGLSVSWRGLAERVYYLMEHQGAHYVTTNYSGCGNTLNFDSPQTVKLVMDSLRYWVEHYHIDGFRFDLATSIARRNRKFDPCGAMMQAIFQDPVLQGKQMIAEPWDLGPEGYRRGGFPRDWQEWNDRYRNGIRAFWRGDKEHVVDLAWRLTGSPDLYPANRPAASVNYICSHDGFTLNDLVSYEHRHNLANGENNRDGNHHNLSWNYGVEGPCDDPAIREARLRARKNLLATLFFSRGITMLQAGDEFSNTQLGNNNSYCQDNAIGWLDWLWLSDSNSDGARLYDFVCQLTALRRQEPILQVRYFDDEHQERNAVLEWFSFHGDPLSAQHLPDEHGHALTMRYRCPRDDHPSLLLLINNDNHQHVFILPESTGHWQELINTVDDVSRGDRVVHEDRFAMPAHCVVMLKAV